MHCRKLGAFFALEEKTLVKYGTAIENGEEL